MSEFAEERVSIPSDIRVDAEDLFIIAHRINATLNASWATRTALALIPDRLAQLAKRAENLQRLYRQMTETAG